MFHVILYQPEIPPNTGNIIRLCANTGCQLHLIKPLGFTLEDKQLVRAGLDYHEFASLSVHDTLQLCLQSLPDATVLPHPNPPPEGAPKAGNPLSSKLDVELTQGTNASLREFFSARRVFALTTKGSQAFHQVRYQPGDAFIFGPESRGLPAEVLGQFDAGQRVRLPMLPDNRSLNLSNTVAVAVFEAWRQCGFEGARTDKATSL
jgi:tRNA (cytidine/uridine-2'-O-)-methyltransferase